MEFEGIIEIIKGKFGEDAVLEVDETATPKAILLPADKLTAICQELHENEATYFDMLSCLTGIDNGPEAGTMEVIYNLYSIPYDHHIMLKVKVARNENDEAGPEIPTVSHIWKTADWHEREAYDLYGFQFTGHPDLRRILLPNDWEGYPMRKDYQHQEYYHGIKVAYEESENNESNSNGL